MIVSSWARALLAALVAAELWDLDRIDEPMRSECRARALSIADRIVAQWVASLDAQL